MQWTESTRSRYLNGVLRWHVCENCGNFKGTNVPRRQCPRSREFLPPRYSTDVSGRRSIGSHAENDADCRDSRKVDQPWGTSRGTRHFAMCQIPMKNV